MKINKISTAIIDIPLKRAHNMSIGSIEKVNVVLVIVENDKGMEGVGETVVLDGPIWSEESAESVQFVINKYIAPLLIGENPENFEYIRQLMERYQGNYFAKSAIEIALFDLVGKEYNIPVYKLLGGKFHTAVPLSWSIAGKNVDEEILEVEDMYKRGIRIFKLKTGVLPVNDDINRVRRIREAFQDDIKIRIDANQGWNRFTAAKAIEEMKKYNVEFFEQPVPKWDINGLSSLAASFGVPLMADESLASVYDAMALIQQKAVHVFGIKLSKAGGLLGGKKIASIAEGAGIEGYVGSMIETGIGTSAHTHFALSTPAITMGCELFGPLLLKEDIVKEKTIYEDGYIKAQESPGLGVTLDESIVSKYIRKSFDHIE